MSLREALTKILKEYGSARKEAFAKHAMADFLRRELPASIKQHLANLNEFKVDGSPGKSNWAKSPWAAIFDPQITESAQSGYYPVYLFREDFSGVYLSLNQGMTEAVNNYKSGAKEALRSRAKDFRAKLGKVSANFDLNDIDLKPSSNSNDSAFYEAGNIVAKFYDARQVPEEDVLKADLREILELYKQLVYGEPSLTNKQQLEDDEQDNQHVEDLTKLRVHKRVERDASLAKKVKKLHGYTCQLCGYNYEAHYGKIGRNYIEAHHLVPVSDSKGQRVKRDAKKDFAVLCANCHRMIHRSDFIGDLEGFRRKYLAK